ncbi:hypothetical protein M432DRAFT_449463 [Thermoascus aurantiacus ATCC 26904]
MGPIYIYSYSPRAFATPLESEKGPITTILYKDLVAYESKALGEGGTAKWLPEDVPAVGGICCRGQHIYIYIDAVCRLLRQPTRRRKRSRGFMLINSRNRQANKGRRRKKNRKSGSLLPPATLCLQPEQHPDPSHLTSVAPDNIDPTLLFSVLAGTSGPGYVPIVYISQ